MPLPTKSFAATIIMFSHTGRSSTRPCIFRFSGSIPMPFLIEVRGSFGLWGSPWINSSPESILSAPVDRPQKFDPSGANQSVHSDNFPFSGASRDTLSRFLLLKFFVSRTTSLSFSVVLFAPARFYLMPDHISMLILIDIAKLAYRNIFSILEDCHKWSPR